MRVDGWFEFDGIEELERACEGAPPHLRLDLSELRAADARSLDALLGLEQTGAVFVGVPPYIGLLLSARRRQGKPDPGDRP